MIYLRVFDSHTKAKYAMREDSEKKDCLQKQIWLIREVNMQAEDRWGIDKILYRVISSEKDLYNILGLRVDEVLYDSSSWFNGEIINRINNLKKP